MQTSIAIKKLKGFLLNNYQHSIPHSYNIPEQYFRSEACAFTAFTPPAAAARSMVVLAQPRQIPCRGWSSAANPWLHVSSEQT